MPGGRRDLHSITHARWSVPWWLPLWFTNALGTPFALNILYAS